MKIYLVIYLLINKKLWKFDLSVSIRRWIVTYSYICFFDCLNCVAGITITCILNSRCLPISYMMSVRFMLALHSMNCNYIPNVIIYLFTYYYNLKYNMQDILPKCIKNNVCSMVCSYKSCDKIPFMCREEDCQCGDQHKKCTINMRWKVLQEMLEEKMEKYKIENAQNLKSIQEIYKQIIKQIQCAYNDFRSQYTQQGNGLSQIELELYKNIKQKNLGAINGDLINRIGAQIKNSSSMMKINFEESKKQIKQQTQKLLKIVDSLKNSYSNKMQLVWENTKTKKLTEGSNTWRIFLSSEPLNYHYFKISVKFNKMDSNDRSGYGLGLSKSNPTRTTHTSIYGLHANGSLYHTTSTNHSGTQKYGVGDIITIEYKQKNIYFDVNGKNELCYTSVELPLYLAAATYYPTEIEIISCLILQNE